MRNVYLLLAILVLVTSCTKDSNVNKGEDLVLTADEQQRTEADNKFSLKLFKELAADAGKDNLVFSPLSLSMAIAMTSNGSSGQTLEGIRAAMEFSGATEEQINSYYNKLLAKLPVLDPAADVKLANSIWYRQDFTVSPAFLQVNKNSYNAAVQPLNFSDPAAPGKINTWVNDKTNGKITEIVDNIPADMIMYLINAVYFKANWKYQFDKSKTQKAVFHTAGDGDVQADFMTIKTSLNTSYSSDGFVVELPYGNEKYSMVLLLPATGKSVQDVINAANPASWNTWMNSLKKEGTTIYLPRFLINYDVELNDILKGFGMELAFSYVADFTRINTNGDLRISKVKQKAFIEVNEAGTEAAAVTSVGIEFTSSSGGIKFDRPFLFAIREMKTGLILFNGIVNNPTK
ncbi:serpin family protein [Chitinophaga sp. SYP-B3965]|uniref:serpin family protein n=1 Tax=Chitinophaga sp. SYP-B3965 TaxID=2663120 RepID=UPI0012995302|nr:serpin family protein [Chitinophaga sp. SYP-B3965]MRG44620.1 serpin family protein [Chitinophaga sp. SYP-B3965]